MLDVCKFCTQFWLYDSTTAIWWIDQRAFQPAPEIVATGGAFAETGGIDALSGNEKSDSMTYSLLSLRANLAEMARR